VYGWRAVMAKTGSGIGNRMSLSAILLLGYWGGSVRQSYCRGGNRCQGVIAGRVVQHPALFRLWVSFADVSSSNRDARPLKKK